MITREEIFSVLEKDPATREECCWQCRWFEADELTFGEHGGDGTCVRYPPVFTGEDTNDECPSMEHSNWCQPRVGIMGYCGEYEQLRGSHGHTD